MVWEEWKENFAEWLEAEDLDSERIIDDKWKVEEEEDKLIASSYRTPFDLVIEHDEIPEEEADYVNISLHTGFETFRLKQNEKEYLYRKMLKINTEAQLMKYALSLNYDEEPIIRTDLDLTSLNKEEFEHALESVITGTHNFFSSVVRKGRLTEILGEDKSWDRYIMDYIIDTLSDDLREGDITMDKAINRLISKDPMDSGWDEEEAKDSIISYLCDHLILDVSEGNKEREEVIQELTEILGIENKETEELIKAYLRTSLNRMVDNKTMDPKETIQWLISHWDLTQGAAYRLINEEGDVRSFMEIIEGIEPGE